MSTKTGTWQRVQGDALGHYVTVSLTGGVLLTACKDAMVDIALEEPEERAKCHTCRKAVTESEVGDDG